MAHARMSAVLAVLLMTGGLAALAETQGNAFLAEKQSDPSGGQSNAVFYRLSEQEQPFSFSSKQARADLFRQAEATGGPHFATVVLTSGVPATFSIGPVSTPTLMTISGAYQITVPQGAPRLEVRVTTTTPGADVDLYVRYDSPPDVVDSTTLYDYRSAKTGTGNETVTITSPRAGVWYITLAMYSTGTSATGTVTATIGGPGAGVLTSGVPSSFSIGPVSSPTLMNIDAAYQITVPQGAQRLEVRVSTTTPGADVDLFVRYGTPPDVVGSTVTYDYKSDQMGTGNETVIITSPQAGVWYITLGLYSTGVVAAGTVTGTIGTSGPVVLSSGVPASFTIGPVSSPTLMNLNGAYQITVPQGAQQLEVRVSTTTPGADVDLYVRRGTPPEVVGGTTVYDYRSAKTGTGNETVTITSPQAGVWYITLALYSTGVTATGTVTATTILPPQIEVFNGAGGQRDWISPGSIAMFVASGLARGVQGCVTPRSPIGPLPLELANVTVAFGESWAPIYSVCNLEGQESVTVQVPFEVPPGNAFLRIRIRGSEISRMVNILEISPGVFEWRMRDGRSRPVMLRPDNSFVSVDNPARRGETIRVYATGLGRLTAPVGTNQTGSALLEARTVFPAVVGVNAAGVEPLYAAYAPNLIGVYEVAFMVPADAPASDNVSFALALYFSSGLVFANSSTFPVR